MTIFIIALIGLAVLVIIIGAFVLAFKPRKEPIQIGKEEMIDKIGEVKTTLDPKGEVFLGGELWKARSISGKIEKGESVRVKKIKGLTLIVEKSEEEVY
ncbi:MAG: hypothetical protein J7M18_05195 [Candidatus Eremiobacteraeota bacterium]|nr:hypothetical protein [Candidatus Eremiobacteraeota bacterium]